MKFRGFCPESTFLNQEDLCVFNFLLILFFTLDFYFIFILFFLLFCFFLYSLHFSDSFLPIFYVLALFFYFLGSGSVKRQNIDK
ncbi:hypothetical protein MSSAC_3278 [Methanosarcina siciliae C2J]|uniref:Uncharacterized protein n=2 Tax=Methanosarcina siciliae TaxID=38027 RepID=A0A0E3PCQ2_9EURY|nr:hypothetical protein MSSIH_1152 [Methanosarcina siciliae HI350]AKB37868.1 hypothetical protein MSSAC_3278 [Methanosarcina siciliae C2J]